MPSPEQVILEAIRRTFFFATNIEDLSGVLRLGEVKQALIARKPYWYTYEHECPIYIDELHSGKRAASVSDLITEKEEFILSKIDNFDYIWTFQPQLWVDDLSLLGKKGLCLGHYLYSYWSNKYHQEKLLLENAPPLLKAHLLEKHSRLKRQFVWPSELNKLSQEWIVSQRESIAGQGVFLSPNDVRTTSAKNVLYRAEKKIWPHIPVCQIAAVAAKKTICFQPSVMIIKEHDGHLDYIGSDFNISSHVPKETQLAITNLTKSVGVALDQVGFKGTYNCDYIYSPETNELYFAEVNPRNSGCQFVIDDKFASEKIAGNSDALFYMPMVLNIYAHIFSDMPEVLKSYIGDNAFIELDFHDTQTSSFAHLNAALAGIADNSKPEKTDGNGEVWSIKTIASQIIQEPFVPTLLRQEEESLY